MHVRKQIAKKSAPNLEIRCTYCVLISVVVHSGSSRKDVQMLFPEEEKIIVEETRSNGQTVVEER